MAGINVGGPRDHKYEKCLNCGAIFGYHHWESHWCPILVNMHREGWKETTFKGKAQEVQNDKANS